MGKLARARNTRVTLGKILIYIGLAFFVKVFERFLTKRGRRAEASGAGGGGGEPFGLLAEGFVDGALDLRPGGVGDGTDRSIRRAYHHG